MQIISGPKPTTAQLRPHVEIIAEATSKKCDPAWKPEPCGLTREELRKIVVDLLG
jgi:hypothetical protein